MDKEQIVRIAVEAAVKAAAEYIDKQRKKEIGKSAQALLKEFKVIAVRQFCTHVLIGNKLYNGKYNRGYSSQYGAYNISACSSFFYMFRTKRSDKILHRYSV